MILTLLLAGCLRDAPLPDLGDCAVYPDGTYDYGQVGIGTCLAGPTELRLVETDDGGLAVLVTNANPYLNFTSGSLLAFPFDELDLSTGRNVVSDLDAHALQLPDFAGGLATWGDLGLVTTRESDEALTRAHDDAVHLVDLSDPLRPVDADRGDDGGPTVAVGADPNDVVVDAESGRAFVSNRTDHTISVLDLTGDTVQVVPPWPEQVVSAARFYDRDRSGSRASLEGFTVDDDAVLPSDDWTMTWVEGTWRLWVPGVTGAWRASTTGDGSYAASAIGVELDPDDSSVVDEVRDPDYDALHDRMLFASGDTIQGAEPGGWLGDWVMEEVPLLEADPEGWDATIGGPSLVTSDGIQYLFYEGGDGETSRVGLAVSADGWTFDKLDEPVLEGRWAHDAGGVFDPFVLYDYEEQRWRMYYGAWDGERWTIGHATSTDLETWESDPEPVFAPEDAGAAAPVVSFGVGGWRMWYARWTKDGWRIGEATSPDGTEWTDLGTVLEPDPYMAWSEEPPGPAMQAQRLDAFRVSGEANGSLLYPAQPGVGYTSITYGWSATPVAGQHLDLGDAGSASDGGIRVDSVDPDAGLAWLTLRSAGGTERIGVATLDEDGGLDVVEGAVFEGADGFDRDGVGSPVVVRDGDTWRMYYAGHRGERTSIGLATSADGIDWTRVGQVLDNGEDWDSVAAIPGSVEVLDDGSLRLWYSGSDGATWRIGAATSADGQTFTRETGIYDWLFAPGAPGDLDDSGVRDPWVVPGVDEDGNPGIHLWYSGFDGDTWRVFYAWRAEGDDAFTRATNETSGETRAVVDVTDGLFHPDGVRRPVLVQGLRGDDDTRWRGFFAGLLDDAERAGRLAGSEPDRLHRVLDRPTTGDTLEWSTVQGDPEAEAIDLDALVDGQSLNAIGLTSLSLDEDRGFLYAVSKLKNYVYVIDARDDSDKDSDFVDGNYLDIEAALPLATASGAQGFRQVLPVPGSDRVLALNDAPEAVGIYDLSGVADDNAAQIVYDTLVGWLPAPRGGERDAGVDTRASIGPAQIALHPDGRRLFLTNFNANSIAVYDLSLGPYGEQVAEVDLVGENPYAITITPDGKYAIFANYAGEVSEDGLVESTLGVLDVDESSPTYLEVLTWLANR